MARKGIATSTPVGTAGYRVAPIALAPYVSLAYGPRHVDAQRYAAFSKHAWGDRAGWPGIVFNDTTVPEATQCVNDPARLRALSLALIHPVQRTRGLEKLNNNQGRAAQLDTGVVFPLRGVIVATLPVPDAVGSVHTVLDCDRNAAKTKLQRGTRHSYVTRLGRGETAAGIVGDDRRCITCTRAYAIERALSLKKPVQVAGLKSIYVNADGTLRSGAPARQ